jgi:hypothetical protein
VSHGIDPGVNRRIDRTGGNPQEIQEINNSDSALIKAGSEMALLFIKRSPETLPVIMPTTGSAILFDKQYCQQLVSQNIWSLK